MTKEKKIDKVTKDFSLLSEEKQDYILGVLQSLVYAHEVANGQNENTSFGSEQNTE